MHIGEILNGVYDDEVGWRPASGSIKPVHIANGLVRALVEKQYDVERLHRVVVWWKRGKQPDEERSYEVLVRDYPEVASLAPSTNEFERVRRFLVGLLNADNGLFPAVRQSDMSLTCAQMTSRSGNDRGLGEFGAALLRNDAIDESLANVLVRAVESSKPEDPISAAIWPLLDLEGKGAKASNRRLGALQRAHNKQFVEAMRAAATDLASHEVAQGNRLRTLERVVQFVCIAPLVQAQWLGAMDSTLGRVPLLLAMGGEQGDEVASASELSLQLVYEGFEAWLSDRLADRLRTGKKLDGAGTIVETSTDGREARRIFRSIESADAGHPSPDDVTLDSRMAGFQEAKLNFERDEGAKVMGYALAAAYFQEYSSGGPREFLRVLSSRVGLIFPPFQGRGIKRLRPSTAVLDMLVRSCVPAGTSIPLSDFLARIWDRFGLVSGGQRTEERDDVVSLQEHGITADSAALSANTEMLISQLAAMGLARRYADNVTFVGDSYAV